MFACQFAVFQQKKIIEKYNSIWVGAHKVAKGFLA